jgi:hypothetical protein
VLGPDPGGDRIGRLVAILVCLHARARVDAEVRVHVDQTRRDPTALCIDLGRVAESAQAACAAAQFAGSLGAAQQEFRERAPLLSAP